MRSIGNARVSTGCAPGGLFPQIRNIHVAEIGQHQCARNRRRGHHENVGGHAFFAQRQTLMDAEAMLFVDHGEAEVAEDHAFLKQGVGANHNIDAAFRQPGEGFSARARRVAAGEER